MNSTIPERYEPKAERLIILSSLPLASWGEAADDKTQKFCMIHAPSSLIGLKRVSSVPACGLPPRCDTCEARAVVFRPYVQKAEAAERPLWQMDLRHKLKLTPGQTDAISMLLWHSIYGSTSTPEVEDRIQDHINELQRALAIIRGES